MVVGLEAMGGVLGLGSVMWASDLVFPLPVVLLFWESIYCCNQSSSVEFDLVRSRGEICASSWIFTVLKWPVMYFAKLPWICGVDGRDSCCSEKNLQLGINVGDTGLELLVLLVVRFRAALQCVPDGTFMLPSMLAKFLVLYHGWADQGHAADVHNLGFERLVAGQFYPAHEGWLQYLSCTVLLFFCSDCHFKLCASAIIPICWSSSGVAGSYIQMLAGSEVGLPIHSHFVLTLELLPIFGRWRPHALWRVTLKPSLIPPGRFT
jgi:hypothetical protein